MQETIDMLIDMLKREQEEYEKKMANKKDFPACKYKRGDEVVFSLGDEPCCGTIYIVDKYGTFGQNDEPSYDIFTDYACQYTLVKHVRQSSIDKLYKPRNKCEFCRYFKEDEQCNTDIVMFERWCNYWHEKLTDDNGFCHGFEDKEGKIE